MTAFGLSLSELLVLGAGAGYAIDRFRGRSAKVLRAEVDDLAVRNATLEQKNSVATETIHAYEVRIAELETKTDLDEVIRRLDASSTIQSQTLEKLGDLNVGLRETNENLRTTRHGLDATHRILELLFDELKPDLRAAAHRRRAG